MDGQFLLVILVVSIAAIYLLRRSWKTWFGVRSGCGGSCGCGAKTEQTEKTSDGRETLIPLQQLMLRKRN
jgi:hypothetical protein